MVKLGAYAKLPLALVLISIPSPLEAVVAKNTLLRDADLPQYLFTFPGFLQAAIYQPAPTQLVHGPSTVSWLPVNHGTSEGGRENQIT